MIIKAIEGQPGSPTAPVVARKPHRHARDSARSGLLRASAAGQKTLPMADTIVLPLLGQASAGAR
ncbi:hypothetical protein [Nonomuraea aridisoli]|uniref:hypothetical protein n=1 Tax=Nonomuraea aridisoli TaxID=2070368 RepID=UPI0011B9443A|nr:hypothetical protein [Nonomuraea aridisoli]